MGYIIVPIKPYRILRNCGGCGAKMPFESTGAFRVNANGRSLDIWLIYQCTKCRHTFNAPIYERIKQGALDPDEYQRFLSNDQETAIRYAMSRQFLNHIHAELDTTPLEYQLLPAISCISVDDFPLGARIDLSFEGRVYQVYNPYKLKVRPDRILAELTGLSRSQVQKQLNRRTNTPPAQMQKTGGCYGV